MGLFAKSISDSIAAHRRTREDGRTQGSIATRTDNARTRQSTLRTKTTERSQPIDIQPTTNEHKILNENDHRESRGSSSDSSSDDEVTQTGPSTPAPLSEEQPTSQFSTLSSSQLAVGRRLSLSRIGGTASVASKYARKPRTASMRRGDTLELDSASPTAASSQVRPHQLVLPPTPTAAAVLMSPPSSRRASTSGASGEDEASRTHIHTSTNIDPSSPNSILSPTLSPTGGGSSPGAAPKLPSRVGSWGSSLFSKYASPTNRDRSKHLLVRSIAAGVDPDSDDVRSPATPSDGHTDATVAMHIQPHEAGRTTTKFETRLRSPKANQTTPTHTRNEQEGGHSDLIDSPAPADVPLAGIVRLNSSGRVKEVFSWPALPVAPLLPNSPTDSPPLGPQLTIHVTSATPVQTSFNAKKRTSTTTVIVHATPNEMADETQFKLDDTEANNDRPVIIHHQGAGPYGASDHSHQGDSQASQPSASPAPAVSRADSLSSGEVSLCTSPVVGSRRDLTIEVGVDSGGGELLCVSLPDPTTTPALVTPPLTPPRRGRLASISLSRAASTRVASRSPSHAQQLGASTIAPQLRHANTPEPARRRRTEEPRGKYPPKRFAVWE